MRRMLISHTNENNCEEVKIIYRSKEFEDIWLEKYMNFSDSGNKYHDVMHFEGKEIENLKKFLEKY